MSVIDASPQGRRILVPAVLLMSLWGQARAQIVAPAGRTLFNQNVMLRCFARVDLFDTAPPVTEFRSVSLPCAVVWGVYPDFGLVAELPFAAVHSEFQTPLGPGGETRSGRGDAVFLLHYDGFYRKTVPRGFTRVAGQFGIRAPVGSSGFTSDAFAYLFTGIFSHIRDRHWLIADAQFTLTTGNGQGLELGNRWNYDLAYLYRLLPLKGFRGDNLFLVFEANGQTSSRSTRGGTDLIDSGGSSLFFSPGLEYLPTRRLVLEFSLPVPIHRDLNGTQPEPRLSVIGGIRILF